MMLIGAGVVAVGAFAAWAMHRMKKGDELVTEESMIDSTSAASHSERQHPEAIDSV